MIDARPPVFDAHLHIIDPRFPLTANHGYLPSPFTAEDYLRRTEHLNVAGGAVVSGSFQGFDQTYLLDALARLGPGFVGVTQLPATATDEQILSLTAAGVRAVRVNLRRGGRETLEHLDTLAHRVHEVAGWHTELYLDIADLADLEPTLAALPRISIGQRGTLHAAARRELTTGTAACRGAGTRQRAGPLTIAPRSRVSGQPPPAHGRPS
jgi:predicted TIM-barrel fold metal-dependent hydrolase